jgi:putative FmdB family regulatory protein
VPTYQYTCTDCGEPVEAVQKFSDPPLTMCAACGGKLRKVFSPVGIVFKGSGFYRTDSRNGSAVKAEGKKDKPVSESSSSDSASSNGSSDKPAAKSSESKSTAAKPSSSEKVA